MKIEVGAPFPGDFLPPKKEGPVLDFSRQGLTLALQLSGIADEEAGLFESSDEFRFALFPQPGFLFLLVEIPGLLEWSDAPYSVASLARESWPETSGAAAPERLVLDAVLVEARDRRVRAARRFELNAEFTARLLQLVEAQKASPLTPDAYLEKLAVAQTKHSATRMVKEAIAQVIPGSGMA